jgi:NAD+ synthase (glutamine-hydrolysing)
MTVAALLQINPTIGALDANVALIVDAYKRACDMGADIVLAPELAVCGYPPKDLILSPSFMRDCKAATEKIAAATGPSALIYGTALLNEGTTDKPIYNAAIVASDGKIFATREKSLLPTYDVFDERRYFAPAPRRSPVEWKGIRLGITVCEDIWRLEFWPGPELLPKAQARPYGVDPISELTHAKVDLMVNISASPYARGKRAARVGVVAECALHAKRPVLYCNQVGGNDSILFDGASFVVDERGRLVVQGKDHVEDIVLWDSTKQYEAIEAKNAHEIDDLIDALEMGLRDYAKKCGFKETVIGLSGGIDSAVTAALACRALGAKNVHGVAMPSRHSSDHSLADAKALAEAWGIDYRVVPIEPMYASFVESLEPSFAGLKPSVAEENLQARIRGSLLMTLSNKFGWLVLSTGNKSETAVGYSTLYGDSCGGLAVIADVPKVDVYKIARRINEREGREAIPRSTIEKPPSAELRPGQFDTDSLPPYEVLDPILEDYIQRNLPKEEIAKKNGVGLSLVERILAMVDRAEYKRQQSPPNLRVSAKAFGYGRRMPIAQGWKH